MAYENALGVQAPYFFLSYHRAPSDGPSSADEDKHVLKFYNDLCRHIRHLTDLDSDIIPGFLDRQMQAGTRWPPAVKNALAECQTFVALYEPRYFRSDYCGYEWACFETRQAQGRPSGSLAYDAIIPVLMVEATRLPDPLPRGAKELQYSDSALPASYASQGIWGLLHSGRSTDYKKTTLAVARRIVDVAQFTRIARCSAEIFDDDANAFADWRHDRER